MDVLGIPTVLVPPDPGNVSAFGLLTVDVKNDYVQTQVSLDTGSTRRRCATSYDELTAQARDALLREGFAEAEHVFARTADLRYFGQAFEVRVPVPTATRPRRRSTAAEGVPRRAPWPTATTSPATRASRSSGSTCGSPGSARSPAPRSAAFPGRPPLRPVEVPLQADDPRSRRVCFDADQGYVQTPVRWRADLSPGTTVPGPVIIEEYCSTVPVHPGFTATVDDFGNLLVGDR